MKSALKMVPPVWDSSVMSLTAKMSNPTAVDCSHRETVQSLYRETGRAALSKTTHVVGRRDVAEEIVQETFLKLWKKRPQFPSEKAAYVWIYKACHNSAIDHLRAAATRRERGSEDDLYPTLENASDSPNVGQKRLFVEQLLRHLGEREARILVYRVIDGMTQEEIADLLGLSRKTIMRANKAIEKKLDRLRRKNYG